MRTVTTFTADEPLITMTAAAKSLPPGRGKRVHASTLYRWCLDRVRGPNGQRIRLDHLRIGRQPDTSYRALQRFAEQQTAIALIDTEPVAPASPPLTVPRSEWQRDAAERTMAWLHSDRRLWGCDERT